ncbi:MAG: DNA mismatch repair endonuclease MutL [Bacteroidetes bacterium]|nr:DNA mismatch repair endonuclease MutL [Bacteroidota bacterium]MBU1720284.1 DNA mismatch repair endonuclease MutL [Bacteroidota bacterium]
MSDIIKVLPDFVANQIAAGEVVQRPSSVVKELVENAIDSGADLISILIRDAGKTSIQVTDNGSGMSENDARLSFERHATSKISNAEDLFLIRTMGFRGEALASIGSVARTELKTKREADEVGTLVEVEASEVKKYEPVQCNPGTTIIVKNLFYNIPARRKFLKSDHVEMNHIIEEVTRAALANPGIQIQLQHNGKEVMHLQSGNLKQRIAGIFGQPINKKLLTVEENTNLLKINGFITKPENARLKKGEQYFFLNNRFVKYPLLNHAVYKAFAGIIAENQHPGYFIFMECDPKFIDVNIHPTKTEVKFEDERTLYSILQAVVKKSLGQFHLAPTLDFDTETIIPLFPKDRPIVEPQISYDPDYNPFSPSEKAGSQQRKNPADNWEELYRPPQEHSQDNSGEPLLIPTEMDQENIDPNHSRIFLLHNTYIITTIKSGLMVIDRTGALERIHYERLLKNRENHKPSSQQLLFPVVVELNAQEYELLLDIAGELAAFGFNIEDNGSNKIEIIGIPVIAGDADPETLLEQFIGQFREYSVELSDNITEKVVRALARNIARKSNHTLTEEEMKMIVDQLFGCQVPYSTPGGKPVIYKLDMDELARIFRKGD